MNTNRKRIMMVFVAAALLCLTAYKGLLNDDENMGTVVINEVCSRNFSVIAGENGDFTDYIELFNAGDVPAGSDLYLSDSKKNLKKYKVGQDIQPQGYLLIFPKTAGGSETGNTSFGISGEGEQIFLSDENGNIIDSCTVPGLSYNTTYSRKTDGNGKFIVATATPLETNQDATELDAAYVESPVFSLNDGFYEEGIELKISTYPWNKIYYTTDGSDPTQDSLVYKGAIELTDASENDNVWSNEMMYPTYEVPVSKVDKANVIRAIAVNRFTGQKSRIETHIYFCGFENKEQYKDTEIMALTLDPDKLFAYEDGIFAMGRRYDDYLELGGLLGADPEDVPASIETEDGTVYWRSDFTNSYYQGRTSEREAVMTVFDANHEYLYSQNIGVRVAGESTRYIPQKSLNLYARDIYSGESAFRWPFFYDNEKKVRLRKGDSNVWYQEPFLHYAVEELGFIIQRSQKEVVFIDGEYWGMYNLREQYDENYFLNYYGIDESNLWLVKNNIAEYGSDEAFESYDYLINLITYGDLSDDEIYDEVCKRVDIDNLIDYFCTLIFFDDQDILPRHNQLLWRAANCDGGDVLCDGRWRWGVYDLDVTCTDVTDNTIELYRSFGDGMYLPGYLCANENFREKYFARMSELLDTTFSYERLHTMLMEWDAEYRTQNIETVNRFEGGGYTESDYEANLEEIDSFLRDRKSYVEQFMADEKAMYSE